MNTPKATINVSDYTQTASTPSGMEVYVSGVTRRGPVNDPSQTFDTYEKYVRVFGGAAPVSMFENPDDPAKDFHIYVQRLFQYGARLRINRIVHNTGDSITNKVKAAEPIFGMLTDTTGGTPVKIFSMQPKYPGADYNGIKAVISPSSNGAKGAFNLDIIWPAYPEYSESYQNIPYPTLGKPASDQTYLDQVMKLSQIIEFTYMDFTATPLDSTKLLVKMDDTSTFAGGSDGDTVTDADFIGNDMGTGISAFDQVQGGMIIAFPGVYKGTIQAKGIAYATQRQDMVYMGSWQVTPNTYETDITEKDEIVGDTKQAIISCGGIKILDANTNKKIVISEIADVIGLCVSTFNNRGAWFDPASSQSASIINAIGVGYNFGTPALKNALNDLANHGINAVVSDSGVISWTSSYTSQKTDSVLSFGSGMFLLLYMKATMMPILRSHLKEPCDVVTFKSIYRQLKPFLDTLASTQNRALWQYEYLGDQDARSLDDLSVNSKEDVQIGKYKIFLKLWVIVPLIDITLNMMLVMGDGEVGIEITE